MSEMIHFEKGKVHVVCDSCGKTNAIATNKITETAVCGSCKAELSSVKSPVELSDETFDELIGQSPIPVLVDFWAPWCGPCRMMGPVLDGFAKKMAGKVLVAKLNTDQSPSVSQRFGIQGIPTLILFRQGKEAERQVGVVPEARLDSLVSNS